MKLTDILARDPAGMLAAVRAEKARRSYKEFVQQAWPVFETVPLAWGVHLDGMCAALEAVARGRLRRLVINIPPRNSKPVWEEETVLERVRGRIRLSEVEVGDHVLTHRGRFRRVLAVHEQGELPLYNVQTHCNRSLSTAADHPFLTTRGWVRADQLSIGDVLAAVQPTEASGTSTMVDEEARLLGYIVGDGCVKYGSRSVTSADQELIDDVQHCAAVLGFRTTVIRQPNRRAVAINILPVCPDGKKKWHVATMGPHPVVAWLKKHDLLGRRSYDKRPPKAIMAGDDRVVSQFLGAYWSCDGSVALRGGSRTDCCVEACTVNELLARDVQHLLLRLGVQSRVRRRTAQLKTRRQGDLYVSWHVSITTLDDAAQFARRVPMKHIEKTNKIKRYERQAFDRVLREDPVVQISVGSVGKCRCLTVEEDESFVAGDLAVHNTSVSTICFPAWVWTWWPRAQFLFVSHKSELSVEHSIKCRQIVESTWYVENFSRPAGWQLRDDQNVKHDFLNTAGGRRRATSITSNITGHGGDIIVFDDPLDAEVALSETGRGEVNRVFSYVASTRLNDPKEGRVVLTMQRLAEEDPVGGPAADWPRLLAPAEFEPERACRLLASDGTEIWRDVRTQPGEPLTPDRFGIEELRAIRKTLGEQRYAGQYQQRPAPAEGNIFRRHEVRFWREKGAAMRAPRPSGCWTGDAVELPRMERVIMSVDATFKKTDSGSFVAIHIWGAAGPNRYLLDVFHERVDFVGTCEAVKALTRKWPAARKKIIEEKANGAAIISALGRQVSGFVPVTPEGGKESRAYAVQAYWAGGNVYLPDGAPWVDEFINECANFPSAANDDHVDAMSQALTELEQKESTAAIWARASL